MKKSSQSDYVIIIIGLTVITCVSLRVLVSLDVVCLSDPFLNFRFVELQHKTV